MFGNILILVCFAVNRVLIKLFFFVFVCFINKILIGFCLIVFVGWVCVRICLRVLVFVFGRVWVEIVEFKNFNLLFL